jgi:hypothetical protein
MRATGFEPATVGFGVQRSTVGATPSRIDILLRNRSNAIYYICLYSYGNKTYNQTDKYLYILQRE